MWIQKDRTSGTGSLTKWANPPRMDGCLTEYECKTAPPRAPFHRQMYFPPKPATIAAHDLMTAMIVAPFGCFRQEALSQRAENNRAYDEG